MINITRALKVAQLHLDNNMVVSEADAKLICQALLASSERRRGLEEAADAIALVLKEAVPGWNDTQVAYDCAVAAIRALEGGEEKTDPIREEMARALEAAQETLQSIATNGRKYGAIYSHAMQALHQIRAALSKHRAPSPPVPSQEGDR